MKLKTFLEKENLNLKFSKKQENIDIGDNLKNHRTEEYEGDNIHIWDYEDGGVLVLDPSKKQVSKLTGWNTGFIEGGVMYDEDGAEILIN